MKNSKNYSLRNMHAGETKKETRTGQGADNI